MSPCMLVQLFKLLSAEGARQLARLVEVEEKYSFTPLKKGLYDPVPVVPVAGVKQ